MTPSQIEAGRTYVGKGGRRRKLLAIRRNFPYPGSPPLTPYETADGHMAECLLTTFARWAEREATPDEAAP